MSPSDRAARVIALMEKHYRERARMESRARARELRQEVTSWRQRRRRNANENHKSATAAGGGGAVVPPLVLLSNVFSVTAETRAVLTDDKRDDIAREYALTKFTPARPKIPSR